MLTMSKFCLTVTKCEWVHIYITLNSGSSFRVRGAKKHEIYVGAFGSHLFYDLFSQGQGGHGPSAPLLDPLLTLDEVTCTG